MIPVIFGLSGPVLTPEERAFFADVHPAGYVFFKRNCETPAQLRALTDSLRDLHGREDVAIMIDQEGGPVSRMVPPHWPAFPAGPVFDALYEVAPMSAIEAARANFHALGLMLAEAGIPVGLLPILDVAREETTPAVSCRTYGHDAMRVAAIGRAVVDGLAAAGIVSVLKHMPGHGRAVVDSHHLLPRVTASEAELEDDIAPFRALNATPMGMTNHVVFEAWDPERPATLSPTVVRDVIRGRIGFDGLLMTDDIDMKALSGTPGEKAQQALAAGCDLVLDCWARMDEMVEIAGLVPQIAAESRARLDRAMASRVAPSGDFEALIAKRDELLALA